MTICIGCGCTDDEACEGGCHWVAVGPRGISGLCSSCEELGIIELEGDELAQELADTEAQADAEESSLILPGDPEYSATLRGQR